MIEIPSRRKETLEHVQIDVIEENLMGQKFEFLKPSILNSKHLEHISKPIQKENKEEDITSSSDSANEKNHDEGNPNTLAIKGASKGNMMKY